MAMNIELKYPLQNLIPTHSFIKGLSHGQFEGLLFAKGNHKQYSCYFMVWGMGIVTIEEKIKTRLGSKPIKL